jgi:acyl transferase domain-containing protein/NAD(P)-dependent dehydrogenase (short-subunit alcohol dehydrogenase family)
LPERFQPLAIVGVSALFPGSSDAHGFWRDILAGRDLITEVPPQRWLIEDHYDPDPHAPDKTYCKRGAFLSDVPFDPVEFGVPPGVISATDTCQLLALLVAKQVLADALQGQFREIDRERASVILGVTSGQELFLEVASRMQAPVWTKALLESGIPEDKVQAICQRIAASYVPWQENTFPGLLGNVVAGRIANRFNLGGTNCVTDAACASSLAAISMAAAELQLGRSDLVIAGGADTFNDISMFVCFSKTPALSPTGDCRPFSDRADGTLLGEGLAMFALRRLQDAERDGNTIYAVIRGIGSSSDGRSKSIYAPLSGGQAKAMRRAYEAAEYDPETVELVEAHGTGTAAGDTAELEGLTSVFGARGTRRGAWCALGSVKSQVGHTKAAAGAAGLFKAVMALHHKILPPTIKVERPHPHLTQEDCPFYVNTDARPWIRGEEHPRRASVSSFGFGGTNFHVTLEESSSGARPALRWTAPSELVLLCASTPVGLEGRCRELAMRASRQTLAQMALSSQLEFDAEAAHRLAIVAESTEDLIRKLERCNMPGFEPAEGISRSAGHECGRMAFLFPGEGGQYPGMTAHSAMMFEDARAVWDRASWLAPLVFPPPAFSSAERDAQTRRLSSPECAQPAIAAASIALLAVLSRLGIKPDCVGGHNLGEIAALHAAGAISPETMLRIARRRGELLSEATSGTGANDEVAVDSFRGFLEECEIASCGVPAYSNIDGSAHPLTPAEWRDRLARQLVRPVCFDALVNRMYSDGVRTFVDLGPGSMLGTLVKSTLGERPHQTVALDLPRTSAVTSLWEALGQLAALGVPMNWSALRSGQQVEVAPEPDTDRFVIPINGGNYGRPYPPPGGAAALPPPVAADPLPVATASPPSDPLHAYRIYQESIGEAHRNWQANLAEGHGRFLKAMESAYLGATGQPLVSPETVFPPVAAPELSAYLSQTPLQPTPLEPGPTTPPSGDVDFREVLWVVVAEATGYPAEMLEPHMALEADLGIDSIKRVEIFSALQLHLSALPELDQPQIAELQTLGDIVQHLELHARSAPETSSLRKIAVPPRRLVVKTSEAVPSGHVTLDPSDGPVSISDDHRVAPHLAELLRDRGYQAEVVDFIPPDAAAVIVLVGSHGEPDSDDTSAANLQAFRAVQTVATRFRKSGGTLVLVRDPADPWTGGLPALARTATLEWPGARVKSIDIETAGRTPREIAEALVNELTAGGPEVEVALTADGRRCKPVATLALAGGGHLEVAPESVFVVSGGGRGITAQCVIELARRTRARMLLLGTGEPGSSEIAVTLEALAEAGSPARYAQVDVRDRSALDTALSEVRREWGPVTGLIHGAGILADRSIENLSLDQFQSVFSTKVAGLRNLLDATRSDPLSVLCVFSSVAGCCGNAGQSAYAMANEAMTRVAYAESALRLGRTTVKAIDWGPWQGGMVTPAMQRHFERLGAKLLGLEEGATAFADELLKASETEIEVMLGDSPPEPPHELRVRISQLSHPYLADHSYQGMPVLPAVEALELILRCAMLQPNSVPPLVCTNLRVLRGVRLDRFYEGGNLLFIRPRHAGVFELCGPGGVLHYEATVTPGTSRLTSTISTPQPHHNVPWDERDIYGKLLFHGPAFQAIQKVRGISSTGIWGTVTGMKERQWSDGYRQSDGAMLDGGLQLACLWGLHSIGKLTLPSRIGRFHATRRPADDGPVSCIVAGKVAGHSKIVCDLEFTSTTGDLVAAMSEVEMYAPPSE